MNLNETNRKDAMDLWKTKFPVFDWETVKRVAQNPRVNDIRELEETLNKIILNRVNK